MSIVKDLRNLSIHLPPLQCALLRRAADKLEKQEKLRVILSDLWTAADSFNVSGVYFNEDEYNAILLSQAADILWRNPNE